ncbi:MAG TPA: site-specific integrase [Xanthobacteraceae bacterium]|jgi:integrase
MSVRKRKWVTSKGEQREAFIADFVDQKGERHIRTFDRKKDADAYAASVRVDVKAGLHTSGKATVADAGARWVTDAEDRLEASTVESYRQHLKDHIGPFIGGTKLSELTVPGVRAFMDMLRKEGRSTAMIKRVVGDLGAILADAQERGLVAQNVVRSLSRNRKKHRQVEERHKANLKVGVDIPTPAEIKAIAAQLRGRWRPLILTAIFTGLRASELRGLKWPDVDLKKNELHVRQRADRYGTIGSPKTKSGQRTVPLPPMLANALREWKLQCPKTELGLVFPTGERERRDGSVIGGTIEHHTNIVQRGLMPAQIIAGVTVPVLDQNGKPVLDEKGNPAVTAKYTGLHALRHFYASWCINRPQDGGLGLPAKVVQYRLGHSSITVTMDTYGHLFPRGDDGAEMAAAERSLIGA